MICFFPFRIRRVMLVKLPAKRGAVLLCHCPDADIIRAGPPPRFRRANAFDFHPITFRAFEHTEAPDGFK